MRQEGAAVGRGSQLRLASKASRSETRQRNRRLFGAALLGLDYLGLLRGAIQLPPAEAAEQGSDEHRQQEAEQGGTEVQFHGEEGFWYSAGRMRTLVIILLLIILVSLGSALVYLVKDRGSTTRTLKALTWRIGLSVLLFLLLMIGFATGLITPHGVTP